MGKFARIFGLIVAYSALITGVVKGEIQYTVLGVGLTVLLTSLVISTNIERVYKKIEKIEKGMEK